MTNEEITNKWAWWQECDERYNMCDSESEAHGEAQCHIDGNNIQGDEAEYMIGRVCHPMDRLGLDWIARNIAETIEENICCWCDDETGAEDRSIELSADDKAALGKMVAYFVRAKASIHWWTTDKKSETTHTYVAGFNDAAPEKPLSRYINSAGINANDSPHTVVEKLEKAIEQEEQKRPLNCGTGYCSCIECVMKTAQGEKS